MRARAPVGLAPDLTARAATVTMGELFRDQARHAPGRIAVEDATRRLRYGELNERVNRLCGALARLGLRPGDRAAILSENRIEYLECALAAAKLGLILACQNWRLSAEELTHCLILVTPSVIFVSPRHERMLASLPHGAPATVVFGDDYEERLAASGAAEPAVEVRPEDGLLILYTSGTTGLPKGALIDHRANLARLQLARIDGGLEPEDAFVCWAPMFHLVGTEQALHALCLGGKILVVDGADIDRIAHLVATERQWWLVLTPGMIDLLVEKLGRDGVRPAGVKLCGALPDLTPPQVVAEASRLLRAPFWNSFGSTETGMLPCAGGRFAPGEAPERLAKRHNAMYRWRLVDGEDRDVAQGTPGEILVRGPTVFSGYWNAEAANQKDFRGGWFHMGDMFRENPDGTLDFVDRVKYLIKSGAENVYPVEIERVLLRDPRVEDCAVVRRADAKWGEVPVAFVARRDASLTAETLMAACRAALAGYKCPKEILFIASAADFPRSTTGKIQRQEVEKWLKDGTGRP